MHSFLFHIAKCKQVHVGILQLCCVQTMFLCIFFMVVGKFVHLTVLTARYTNIETASNPSFYQCYRSVPDMDAALTFSRTASIPSASAPPPPRSTAHTRSELRHVRVVKFPNDGNWDINGAGSFYCRGTKTGYNTTTVSTFFVRSDSKSWWSLLMWFTYWDSLWNNQT